MSYSSYNSVFCSASHCLLEEAIVNVSMSSHNIQITETIVAATKKVTGKIQEEVQKRTMGSKEETPTPAQCG